MINLNVTTRLSLDALEERLTPVMRIFDSRLLVSSVYRRLVAGVWIVLEVKQIYAVRWMGWLTFVKEVVAAVGVGLHALPCGGCEGKGHCRDKCKLHVG